MSSNKNRDKSKRTAASEEASRTSPADRFNIDREGPAKRAVHLQAQRRRFQKLNEHCDEAVAEIRASLERARPG